MRTFGYFVIVLLVGWLFFALVDGPSDAELDAPAVPDRVRPMTGEIKVRLRTRPGDMQAPSEWIRDARIR